ncbi:MAG: hypothetical protein ABIG39_01140 [Candidatus Micrarchaeota archaeon]
MEFLNNIKKLGKTLSEIGAVPCSRCGVKTKKRFYYGDRAITKLADRKYLKSIPLCPRCRKDFTEWSSSLLIPSHNGTSQDSTPQEDAVQDSAPQGTDGGHEA